MVRMLGMVLFTCDQDQLVGSVNVALASAPPPPVYAWMNGTIHHAFSNSTHGPPRICQIARRRTPAHPTRVSASNWVPTAAQAPATTNIGGLKARKAAGRNATPASGVGTRRPCAARSAKPVMNATVATEMMFNGFGSRVRKNPLITA